MASALGSPSDEGSISGGFESPSSYHVLPSAEVLSSSERDEKVTNLLNFLLMKYQMKELVTEAEIMNIIQNYSHFSVIFSEVSECMQLVFGVDMKVVEPLDHTYVLVTILGISYDGLLSEVQGMPKTGLLVLILSIIFLQGDRAPEEEIWRTLNVMGIWAGVQHFIYGDPRKLILEDFVQEQYLVYQQVPNSNPARYEFLWGPRAHAETSKLKILEFLAGISGTEPTFFGQRYEEALRDEEVKVQARIAAAFAPASASCGATSSFFYPK
ncbi:melanoma-associated antigen 10-like [Erethizon dorsatum]